MVIKSWIVWGWLGFLLLIDILIPWYVLSGDARFAGAFLFWVIWTAVAVASMFFVFLRWRE